MTRIPTGQVADLRSASSRIMPRRVGRVYEAGTITTSNLWTDDLPLKQVAASKLGTDVPAGYEVRWWVLNRQGNEDDVVADVLEFTTRARAEDALERAASTRCRHHAAAHPGRSPSEARQLVWVNPDNAREWDVLFVRGRRLYRVADVPPSYPPVTGQAERRRQSSGVAATTQALACALPAAACQGRGGFARVGDLATLTSSPSLARHGSRALERTDARAYARAVNLRGYDVPDMRRIAPEAPASQARADSSTVSGCVGPRSTPTVAAIDSPVFVARGRLRFALVVSRVILLATERAANRYLNVVASARARACIARDYRRGIISRAIAARGQLRVGRVSVSTLDAPTPASYRGVGSYQGVGVRLVMQTSYATRLGRRVQLPFVADSFVFADGPAVVVLTAESAYRPFSHASEQYLLSKLVGRVEANRG